MKQLSIFDSPIQWKPHDPSPCPCCDASDQAADGARVIHNCQLCGGQSTQSIDDIELCDDCHVRVIAYQDKREGRIDRMEARQRKDMAEYRSRHDRAHQMAQRIPFGQPMMPDHYSYKRDVAYRTKIENGFRKAFEAYDRTQKRLERIKAAQSNTAISSDDPLALIKLREKLAALEAAHQRMVDANKVIRKYTVANNRKKLEELGMEYHRMVLRGPLADANKFHAENIKGVPQLVIDQEKALPQLIALGISEADAKALVVPNRHMGHLGFPSFDLTNSNGNIRRVKERIAELEAKQTASKPSQENHGEITLRRDADDNRIRLIFPGKPAPEVIALLKQHGFKWSPANRAWQRHLNAQGESAARYVLKKLGVRDE